MSALAPSSPVIMARKARGFTLVELLVVIGIIALLISILLPSLQKARQSAQTIACAANLHGLGLACAIYQANNKGVLPPLSQTATVASATSLTPGFSSNGFKGFNIWALLGYKAGNRGLVCPSLTGNYPAFAIYQPVANLRNFYTYKYNWLLSGAETNTVVAPNLPHAYVNPQNPTVLLPSPMRTVPFSNETLLFAQSAQIVCYETDDIPGSDRGMPKSNFTPGLTTAIPGSGSTLTHQYIRGLSPVHGNLLPATNVTYPVLSDGMVAQQGQVNVCFADYHVTTLACKQGQVLNTADPVITELATDAGANGVGHSGNQCYLPGVRLNPTVGT